MTDTHDIVQLSKDFVAAQMDGLRGAEDPQAFQVLKDSDDVLGVSLVDIPRSDNDRDLMADYLAAACCVHQAVEATFASSAWSSMYSNPAIALSKAPSERDNRVEIVMLVHVTPRRVETHTAAILRVGDRVSLSPWLKEEQQGSIYSAGRIPEALKLGIGLTEKMPQEMVDALVAAREVLPPGRIVEMFVKQIREVRDQAQESAQRN